MTKVPLNVLTLYADLVQSMVGAGLSGSVYRLRRDRVHYLYVREHVGATYISHFIGRADDPAAIEKSASIKSEATRARIRRNTVRMIKAAGIAGPSTTFGQILDSLSWAGLFEPGRLVLVDTAAAGIYPLLIGHFLSSATVMTQDIDLAVISLATGTFTRTASMEGPQSVLEILHRGDPTLTPINTCGLPNQFRGDEGIIVEFLSPPRRGHERLVDVPSLRVSAEIMPYMEYLLVDPIPAVLLHGAGVFVRVPQPARFAVHKLIVAQLRQTGDPKRMKDLLQAHELIQALGATRADDLADAFSEARKRGRKWSQLVSASLREIDTSPSLSARNSPKTKPPGR